MDAENSKKEKIPAAVLILAAILAAAFLFRTPSQEDAMTEETAAFTESICQTALPAETVPEETWPEIRSDQNLTNFLIVGQAAREGESARIADTMILCSVNRQTKTLTMTSLMRDLRLVWPEFKDADGKPHYGHNRINMAYNMGCKWAGSSQGGMALLGSIVEHNFGVKVDHSVEVDFGLFMEVIDLLGGVTVDFTEEEIGYMQKNYGDHEPNALLEPGENHINGWQALCYARMRKVGNGDAERTERQREVISNLLEKLRDQDLFKILELFETIRPMVTTDMTARQITDYALEFIPMLKDLNIRSQRIPFDGTYWHVTVDIEGQPVPDQQIDCNVRENGKLLRQSIGLEEAESTEE